MNNLSLKWRGFLGHLGVYGLVIGLLAIINLSSGADELWFQWPAMGWGVGLAFHLLGISLASMKQVSGKWRGFLGHLGSYTIIITMLALINLFSGSGEVWFHWPAMGWGVAVALHFLSISLFGAKQQEQEKAAQPRSRQTAEPQAQPEAAKQVEKTPPPSDEYGSSRENQNPVIHAHLDKARAYQAQIERLITASASSNARARLQDLAAQVNQWVEAIEDLVRRIDSFQQDNLIRQDLEAVPQAIAKLEAQVTQENNPGVRSQLERTLNTRRNQLAALEGLQNTMKRAEIQIESTLSALGTIYSQLLTGESTDHVANYSRLSAEVDEEVRLLQDRLEALEEVRLNRV